VQRLGRQARQRALEQTPGRPQLLLCFRRARPLLQLAQLGAGKVGLADQQGRVVAGAKAPLLTALKQ
jgi:hypothetical protein